MDYQLVLQFKGDAITDFDSLVTLEENLMRIVEPAAEVDGHDIGSGEINIFVIATDPIATFALVKPLLSEASLLHWVVGAYRELSSNNYIVVWPESSTEAFAIV